MTNLKNVLSFLTQSHEVASKEHSVGELVEV
jgi:hypothetical protein